MWIPNTPSNQEVVSAYKADGRFKLVPLTLEEIKKDLTKECEHRNIPNWYHVETI